MLTSFSSNFLAYIEGAYIPHMIFQRSKGIAKLLKTFHGDWGTNFGGLSTCGIND